MDRVLEATEARGGWNTSPQKTATLDYLNAAREKFRGLATSREGN